MSDQQDAATAVEQHDDARSPAAAEESKPQEQHNGHDANTDKDADKVLDAPAAEREQRKDDHRRHKDDDHKRRESKSRRCSRSRCVFRVDMPQDVPQYTHGKYTPPHHHQVPPPITFSGPSPPSITLPRPPTFQGSKTAQQITPTAPFSLLRSQASLPIPRSTSIPVPGSSSPA